MRKIRAEQTRTHMGHSHGHQHNHDNTLLTSRNRDDPGVRITRIGLYVNLGMAIVKGAGGYIFNSQALLADGIHAMTDLVSDIMTLATITYSLRPATTRFPTGYGKIESLGALGVSGILLSGGLMIGLQAIMALSQQFLPELAHVLSQIGIFEHAHSHNHEHGSTELGPNINAAWLAGGSIIIKEWLYRATMKVSKQKRSSLLASNAYHHRVDSLTAFVALLTISASHFISNAQWLDPVGGLLISMMIVQAGWTNSKTALLELADVSINSELKDKVRKAAVSALDSKLGDGAKIRGVQGVKSGQNILIEVEVATPGNWPVSKTTDLEKAVRAKIGANVRGVRRVVVHFSTAEKDQVAFADEYLAGGITNSDSEAGDDHHAHEHEHEHTNGHVTAPTVETDESARKRR